MYVDAGVKIEPKIALLMCSAIISDTLIFRSPTCTEMDREAGKALAEIAGINIKEHAHEMFFAGSNISEKTAKERFYRRLQTIFYRRYDLWYRSGVMYGW